MNRRSVFCVVVSLLSLSMLFVCPSFAQTVPPLDKIQNQQELDSAITTLDAALFDAYNKCDLDKFASYIDENVEFYHDQGGVTLGRAALTDSVKKNICGKTTRELLPGSLHVYYMKGYGALEVGIHRFHHPGHEDTEGIGEGFDYSIGVGLMLVDNPLRTVRQRWFQDFVATGVMNSIPLFLSLPGPPGCQAATSSLVSVFRSTFFDLL